MKKKEIEKLLNKQYSVKQMIAYFIVGFENASDKQDMKGILNSIAETIVKVENTKVLDMIDIQTISKVDYYWNLNVEQVLSYGYLIFERLLKAKQIINVEDIMKEFLVIVKLYSADNAVECVDNKFKE